MRFLIVSFAIIQLGLLSASHANSLASLTFKLLNAAPDTISSVVSVISHVDRTHDLFKSVRKFLVNVKGKVQDAYNEVDGSVLIKYQHVIETLAPFLNDVAEKAIALIMPLVTKFRELIYKMLTKLIEKLKESGLMEKYELGEKVPFYLAILVEKINKIVADAVYYFESRSENLFDHVSEFTGSVLRMIRTYSLF